MQPLRDTIHHAILIKFDAAWGDLSRGEYALKLDHGQNDENLILAMSLYCQILGLCVLWPFKCGFGQIPWLRPFQIL